MAFATPVINGATGESDVTKAVQYLKSISDGRLNLVAIGKTGEGKSSTLNTIMKVSELKKTVEKFRTGDTPSSVTKAMDHRLINLFGLRDVKVIDTVGLFDPEETPFKEKNASYFAAPELDEEHQAVLATLSQVVAHCAEGIHAFIFVIQGGQRFTMETTETIKIILRFFGSGMLDFVIFVVTKADQYSPQTLDGMKNRLVGFLAKTGYHLHGDRFVFFDNENEEKFKEEVQQLLVKLQLNLQHMHGRPYTHTAFKIAQNELAKEKKRIKEEAQAELNRKITDETQKIEQKYQAEAARMEAKITAGVKQMEEMKNATVQEKAQFEEKLRKQQEQMFDLAREKDREMQDAIERANDRANERMNDMMRGLEQQLADNAEQMKKQSEINQQLQKQMAEMSRPIVHDDGGGCHIL